MNSLNKNLPKKLSVSHDEKHQYKKCWNSAAWSPFEKLRANCWANCCNPDNKFGTSFQIISSDDTNVSPSPSISTFFLGDFRWFPGIKGSWYLKIKAFTVTPLYLKNNTNLSELIWLELHALFEQCSRIVMSEILLSRVSSSVFLTGEWPAGVKCQWQWFHWWNHYNLSHW